MQRYEFTFYMPNTLVGAFCRLATYFSGLNTS